MPWDAVVSLTTGGSSEKLCYLQLNCQISLFRAESVNLGGEEICLLSQHQPDSLIALAV